MENLANSYMITNRVQVTGTNPTGMWYGDTPTEDNKVFFMTAPTSFCTNYYKYQSVESSTSSTMLPDSFKQKLISDLKNATELKLVVYIHGMSLEWDGAVRSMGHFAEVLNAHRYNGLMIGYSWPSYPIEGVITNYCHDRKNIDNSVGSFCNFIGALNSLKSVPDFHDLSISVVCHSEGNYMMLKGAESWSGGTVLDQILLAAADIDYNILDANNPKIATQGDKVIAMGKQVTVYYTNNDGTLKDSAVAYHFCVQRLGEKGPTLPTQGKVIAVDCTNVLTKEAIPQNIPRGARIVHDEYFFLKEPLSDIAMTLNGIPAEKITTRTPKPEYARAYTLIGQQR